MSFCLRPVNSLRLKMSGRSSYDQTDSVEIQRAKAQREREQQIRQFKEEAETCPIQQTGLLHHHLFPAPRKLADGDPTARRILGEHDAIRKNYDSFIGIQGDQPQTPVPRKSHSLGFAFPKISPENNRKSVNGIIKSVPPVDQKYTSSSATGRNTSASNSNRQSSSKYEPSSANNSDRTSTNQKREKDKRRSSKERGVVGGSASEKSSHKTNNDHRHDNRSPAIGISNNQHHHDETRSRSRSPYGGSAGVTSQKSSKSHQSVHNVPDAKSHSKPPHKEEISPTKSVFHSPPNGAVIPDGALEQLKKKIPKLQLPQKNKTTLTSGLSSESNPDVDDILKEMTGTSYIQPHNPIHTPVKDHKKFPFPAVAPIESHHLKNVFSLESELMGEAQDKSPVKTEVKEPDITNGKMDIDSDNETEEIPPNAKSPQNRSVTTTSLEKGSVTTTSLEKGGGVPKSGRGRPTAPVKENSNLKSMSSDESSGSDSEYSSGESESEDNSTDDEEKKKKEVEIPKPKTPPPLISPPPSNEKKSWALGNFIPTPDCPSPNFPTNGNVLDKSLNGSFKEDPNNDLLDDLIPNIIENFGNNSDGDHEFDLDPFDHVNRRNKTLLNNKNPFGKIKDICSSEGGSSDEEDEDTKPGGSLLNHISSSSSPIRNHNQVSSAPSKNGLSSEKNKTKSDTTPTSKKQSKHFGKKAITPLSEKKSKKSQKAKIESDNEEEFVDVEYLTPEKLEAREEHNVDIIKNNKSAVTKLDFSDYETTPKQKELENNVCSRKNSATEEKNSKKNEKRKYVKSENKNSGKSAKDVTKSDKNSKKNSSNKTKEREKHKDKKRNENKENKENEKIIRVVI
ncbi:hypothetical protein KUTeg_025049 [Tegillarca granosa]|uniref:Uncharacterized protein n=1 Tax=Tegillarca granosa TaxID=220873 RepID=A0ABQ9DZ65_TEGGR|nr:hypothetical protein KUTeg_025049 [Tegillarca granosa]